MCGGVGFCWATKRCFPLSQLRQTWSKRRQRSISRWTHRNFRSLVSLRHCLPGCSRSNLYESSFLRRGGPRGCRASCLLFFFCVFVSLPCWVGFLLGVGGVGVFFSLVCFPCWRRFGCPFSLALFLERLSGSRERVSIAVLCQNWPFA